MHYAQSISIHRPPMKGVTALSTWISYRSEQLAGYYTGLSLSAHMPAVRRPGRQATRPVLILHRLAPLQYARMPALRYALAQQRAR